MITVLIEYPGERSAVGRAQAAAASAGGLFPGHPVQVIQVEPGTVAAHGARYGPAAGTAGEMLAAVADGRQLDEALAGLRRIAEAAGIWQATWQADSIGQVCDMLAAWCRGRRPA
jgi:hypothetical protein